LTWRIDRPIFHFHEVQDVTGASNEKEFHQSIVNRDEAEEKVEISGDEYTKVQRLRFEGNACNRHQFQW